MRKLQTTFLLFLVVFTLPAIAATRHRAVGVPTGLVPYTSTVVDATTNKPVVGAEVVFQASKTVTDANGSFTIPLNGATASTITISRSGYDTLSVTIQPGVPPSPIRLTPHATVTVKMKSGQTVQIDSETAEMFYSIPLLTTVHSKNFALCKDGTPIEIPLANFTRMSNIVRASGGACCHIDTLWFDGQLKDGTTSHMALQYDCATYDSFFGGRDHTTYQMQYLKLDDISEITFP